MKEYAGGRVSRREFVLSLPGIFIARRLIAQSATKAPIAPLFLSHVVIAASDLRRSVAFYEKLFGAPIEQDNVAMFGFANGSRFLGVTEATRATKPGYLPSYGLAIDNFDPDRTMKVLADAGVMGARITMRGTTPELRVPDPSGIMIHLHRPGDGVGSGRQADNPRVANSPTLPPFMPKTLNHLTLRGGSMEFYQKVFGLRVQSMQGSAPMLALGPGPDFLAGVGNNPTVTPGGIGHACLGIENFDPQKVMGVLISNGLEPVEYGGAGSAGPTGPARAMACQLRFRQRANNGGGPTSPIGTPELMFTDPDNIPVQIQDVKYCGGSGWLGEVCV
jgi:predicted enzyme related to lactoylglutathione lyase